MNEMTQLRGQGVRIEKGIWIIRITPEAGRVKTGRWRDVPLHRDLVAQGFPDFVRARGNGPLFYDPTRSRGGSAAHPIYRRSGKGLPPGYGPWGSTTREWTRTTRGGIVSRRWDVGPEWIPRSSTRSRGMPPGPRASSTGDYRRKLCLPRSAASRPMIRPSLETDWDEVPPAGRQPSPLERFRFALIRWDGVHAEAGG